MDHTRKEKEFGQRLFKQNQIFNSNILHENNTTENAYQAHSGVTNADKSVEKRESLLTIHNKSVLKKINFEREANISLLL